MTPARPRSGPDKLPTAPAHRLPPRAPRHPVHHDVFVPQVRQHRRGGRRVPERVDLPRHRRPPIVVPDDGSQRGGSRVKLRGGEVNGRDSLVVGYPPAADDVHAPVADEAPEELEPRGAAGVASSRRRRGVDAVLGRCLASLALQPTHEERGVAKREAARRVPRARQHRAHVDTVPAADDVLVERVPPTRVHVRVRHEVHARRRRGTLGNPESAIVAPCRPTRR